MAELSEQARDNHGWFDEGQWVTSEDGVLALIRDERNRLAAEVEKLWAIGRTRIEDVSDADIRFFREHMLNQLRDDLPYVAEWLRAEP